MFPLRIACVRYLNTAPLIEGLEKLAGIELIPTVPSRIAEMLTRGEADIGLGSVVDAALPAAGLALLPVGMIGCDGPTMTVRLFSATPLAQVRELHADTDSHTSIVLARLILKVVHGADVTIRNFHAREHMTLGTTAGAPDAWPPALLLIGDKVVTDSPPADRYPHQLDLGQAWKELTGLPFVYAVWMCRAAEADSPRIVFAAAILDRQRRHNMMRLSWLARRAGERARWPLDLAHKYLGAFLRYEVGPREREGVDVFLARAADLGLIEERHVRWAEPAGAQPASVAGAAGLL